MIKRAKLLLLVFPCSIFFCLFSLIHARSVVAQDSKGLFLASPFDFSTTDISVAEMAFAALYADKAYDDDPWCPLDQLSLLRGGPEKALVDTEVKVSRLTDKQGARVWAIAFRGTEGIFSKDILTDILRISMVTVEPYQGRLHDGFRATAANALYLLRDHPQVINELISGQAKAVVTGHSLGGAAAVVFSAWLIESGIVGSNQISPGAQTCPCKGSCPS
ncbi:MAG: hypothetical protein A2511_03925 [Deltaproteobacteria bacterium RIFOXYD12_FULL_50_9]|nr:MAG: hypothetical protein A2511_03925 [Deltaproteobacteria bacterium RIFOXYD12_FULL_50_9]